MTRVNTLSLILLCLYAGACSPKSIEKHFIKDCILPDDQKGTVIGKWKLLAVPIALQAGAFNAAEAQAITSAADTWNEFFAYSFGLPSVDYGGNPSNPRTSTAVKSSNICGTGLIQNGKFVGSIVIYKDATWPYSSATQAMAFTTSCKTPVQNSVPNIYMQIMELNYQYFFASGLRQPDLQTIVLHELGHVLGLDHSCENTNKSGFPNCSSSSLNPDYYSALMYPVFGFDSMGFGEQKRALGVNDQGRVNCLYQGI